MNIIKNAKKKAYLKIVSWGAPKKIVPLYALFIALI